MELPLFKFEQDLLSKGVNLVAGVDEVGRGPLAGPMVVAAVILDVKKIAHLLDNQTNNDVARVALTSYAQINDSKRVTPIKRGLLDIFLRNEAINYSLVTISNTELDTWGITKATQCAFYKSVTQLNPRPVHVLTDTFEINNLTKDCQTNIIKGDTKSISIAAASIIAKVYRDKIMDSFDKIYPMYGFKQHKGYGTKAHINALNIHGPCEIHRKSFAPIASLLHID